LKSYASVGVYRDVVFAVGTEAWSQPPLVRIVSDPPPESRINMVQRAARWVRHATSVPRVIQRTLG